MIGRIVGGTCARARGEVASIFWTTNWFQLNAQPKSRGLNLPLCAPSRRARRSLSCMYRVISFDAYESCQTFVVPWAAPFARRQVPLRSRDQCCPTDRYLYISNVGESVLNKQRSFFGFTCWLEGLWPQAMSSLEHKFPFSSQFT